MRSFGLLGAFFVLLATLEATSQAAPPQDFQKRVQIRAGGGYLLALLDDTILYYGRGRKGTVTHLLGAAAQELFITVDVDGTETVRLWAPFLEKSLDQRKFLERTPRVVLTPLAQTDHRRIGRTPDRSSHLGGGLSNLKR